MTITTERVADAVDVLTFIAAGPMGDACVNQAERVALLTLVVADHRGERLVMSELSHRIGLSRAAVTSLIDRLATKRYVERQPDIEDRRRTHLVVTEKGRAIVDEALAFDELPARERGVAGLRVVTLLGALVVLALVAAYPLALVSSRETVSITVEDKERGSGTGENKTATLVFATDGTYRVGDSLLALHFSSADTYRKLKRGETYSCTVQGWRVPLLSAYPNILECDR